MFKISFIILSSYIFILSMDIKEWYFVSCTKSCEINIKINQIVRESVLINLIYIIIGRYWFNSEEWKMESHEMRLQRNFISRQFTANKLFGTKLCEFISSWGWIIMKFNSFCIKISKKQEILIQSYHNQS